jgi:hypothetical protein
MFSLTGAGARVETTFQEFRCFLLSFGGLKNTGGSQFSWLKMADADRHYSSNYMYCLFSFENSHHLPTGTAEKASKNCIHQNSKLLGRFVTFSLTNHDGCENLRRDDTIRRQNKH